MRSTRYSLTARGRSVSPSLPAAHGEQFLRERQRLDAAPRAGRRNDAPHAQASAGAEYAASRDGLQFARALRRPCGRPACARARRAAMRGAFGFPQRQRFHRVRGAARHQDLAARFEELLQPLPFIGHDRRAACRSLEQPARGAVPHRRHRAARHAQRQFRGAVERGVLGRRHVRDEEEILRPRKVPGYMRSAQQEAAVGQPARGFQKQRVERGLPVRGVCAQIREAGARRRGWEAPDSVTKGPRFRRAAPRGGRPGGSAAPPALCRQCSSAPHRTPPDRAARCMQPDSPQRRFCSVIGVSRS